ncbi:MAG TPA: ribosome-associated translation inhibitor RaiA [Alphaproteobacteria bacterium]|nr:ribosome-associated translation inhibitor RaiA [Alphaproteobacteria bacterium]
MQIQITGKKIEVGEALRRQAEDKIKDISKKYDLSPLECSITFSKDWLMIKCDIEMHVGCGIYIRAHKETNDAYVSLEQAIETFEKRLRRHKQKLIDHTKKRDVARYAKEPAFQYVISSQNENEVESENPLIIAEMTTEIPTLTVGEAVMHLDLSDSQAMLFNNSAHDQLNVVYRRADGNIGWIAPSKNSNT